MAEIIPFCGVRYDAAHLQCPLSDLCAPPYDVIAPDEQSALYARHPCNVVRLILGREEDKYARAASLFREWLADGTLAADPAPAVYVYRQTFRDPLTGQMAPERLGLVCLLKLEEYETGGVLPHEKTLHGAKADRMELTRATDAQMESIYGLYSDPDRATQSFLREYDDREPVMEQVDDMIGSSHKVERIVDPSAVAVLQEMLRDKPVFIADGHHRYETALAYRREQRAEQAVPDGASIPADFILITLTAFEDEGLLVLPTHRLVRGVSPEKIAALPSELAAQFDVTLAEASGLEAAIEENAQAGRIAFGFIGGDGSASLLTLRVPPEGLLALVAGTQADAVKRLPVTLLHHLILDTHLGIGTDALASGQQVAYTRDAGEAARRVQSGEFQAAFLLGRPSVSEVRDVSLARETMPQKSTFFFPKLLSGLLLRDLRLDDTADAGE